MRERKTHLVQSSTATGPRLALQWAGTTTWIEPENGFARGLRVRHCPPAVSSAEAYRIQNTVSEKHLEIYRHYVQQDAAVSQLRRTIWLAGNYVRDFFIKTGPAEADLLRKELRDLEQQSRQAMDQIDGFGASRQTQSALNDGLQEFWKVVYPIPDSMLKASDAEQYAFVQQEIVPRRELGLEPAPGVDASRATGAAAGEADFEEARRDRRRSRLVLMLGSSVVLALVCPALSLRYSEALEREKNLRFEEAVSARKEQERALGALTRDRRRRQEEVCRGNCTTRLARRWRHYSWSITACADARSRLGRIRERLRSARVKWRSGHCYGSGYFPASATGAAGRPGIWPALQWQAEEFTHRSRHSCEFHDDGLQDMLPD